MTFVHICRAPQFWFRRVRYCYSCRTRRRHLEENAAWWGTTITCCACGGRREEGGYMKRQAWSTRQTQALQARARWAAAPPRVEAEWALWNYMGGES